MLFEWDESKRQRNLAKHYIDFQDVKELFAGPVYEKTITRQEETRILAIGLMKDIAVVVVYVMRGKLRRIISARRAHRNERQEYQNHFSAEHGKD